MGVKGTCAFGEGTGVERCGDRDKLRTVIALASARLSFRQGQSLDITWRPASLATSHCWMPRGTRLCADVRQRSASSVYAGHARVLIFG
jgi:hypothetical protein